MKLRSNLNLKGIQFTSNWGVLSQLLVNNPIKGITLKEVEDVEMGKSWELREIWDDETTFLMKRSIQSGRRNTITDKYGLLGISLINLDDKSVILTEGVSDYITQKLLNPDKNVLGLTTLSGSVNAKKIIVSLFDTITITSDDDSMSNRNTGMSNAFNMKTIFERYNKKVKIQMPEFGYKDITDNFIAELKLCQI